MRWGKRAVTDASVAASSDGESVAVQEATAMLRGLCPMPQEGPIVSAQGGKGGATALQRAAGYLRYIMSSHQVSRFEGRIDELRSEHTVLAEAEYIKLCRKVREACEQRYMDPELGNALETRLLDMERQVKTGECNLEYQEPPLVQRIIWKLGNAVATLLAKINGQKFSHHAAKVRKLTNEACYGLWQTQPPLMSDEARAAVGGGVISGAFLGAGYYLFNSTGTIAAGYSSASSSPLPIPLAALSLPVLLNGVIAFSKTMGGIFGNSIATMGGRAKSGEAADPVEAEMESHRYGAVSDAVDNTISGTATSAFGAWSLYLSHLLTGPMEITASVLGGMIMAMGVIDLLAGLKESVQAMLLKRQIRAYRDGEGDPERAGMGERAKMAVKELRARSWMSGIEAAALMGGGTAVVYLNPLASGANFSMAANGTYADQILASVMGITGFASYLNYRRLRREVITVKDTFLE